MLKAFSKNKTFVLYNSNTNYTHRDSNNNSYSLTNSPTQISPTETFIVCVVVSFLSTGANQGSYTAYNFSLSKSILPLGFFMPMNIFFPFLIQGMYVA